MRLLSIDSGLAAPAAVMFDSAKDPGPIRNDPGNLQRAAACFGASLQMVTDKGLSDVDRCKQLHGWAFRLSGLSKIDVAIIEQPVYWGSSSKVKKAGGGQGTTAADINRLFMAIGAIACGTAADRVLLMKAFKSSKEERHAIVHHLFRLNLKAALIPSTPDELDATYTGLWWLASWFTEGDALWDRHVEKGELHHQPLPPAGLRTPARRGRKTPARRS